MAISKKFNRSGAVIGFIPGYRYIIKSGTQLWVTSYTRRSTSQKEIESGKLFAKKDFRVTYESTNFSAEVFYFIYSHGHEEKITYLLALTNNMIMDKTGESNIYKFIENEGMGT